MGLKIKVHYTFYIFLFFSVYFCDFFMFFYYFISLVIHELSHHFMSRTSSKVSQTITLFPFGLALNVNDNCENKFYNFLIFFIGPFVNILIALICIALWWVFPTLYFYLKNLCLVNLSLGLFNLIPLQPLDGGNIFLLFGSKTFDIKWVVIPFVVLVMVATTNSVNLTDGLDGLAGSVSFVYLLMFIAICSILGNKLYLNGETGKILTNFQNINMLSASFMGAILGFLMFNTNKASIFMGDVGSLCLGGYIGASACLLGLEFLVLVLGVCFVFSAVSVILQVVFFKLTKKRIFKMAPFHHHLQMSGLTEPKIVAIYSAVTFCVGLICIIFYLL